MTHTQKKFQAGFSVVELMIAMLLSMALAVRVLAIHGDDALIPEARFGPGLGQGAGAFRRLDVPHLKIPIIGHEEPALGIEHIGPDVKAHLRLHPDPGLA